MNRFRKIIAGLGILSILLPFMANAATSYEVYDLPPMYLNTGITSTQVSSITIAAPTRNGVVVTIPAMSGAIFHIAQNGKEEDVYATRVAVSSSTSAITLTGITRDLCFNQSRTFSGCSTAQAFQKGAQVLLTDDARLFNLKANIDRANTFTMSGSIAFTQSGSIALPTFATTAAANQQLGSNPGGPVRLRCITASGTCSYYIGGAWINFGSGSTTNANTTTRGAVETSTVSDISGATILGDSGAPVVLTTNLIIRGSSGAINARNKVVATNNTGYLSGSLLPNIPVTKLNSGVNATATTFWRGDGAWASPTTIFGTGGVQKTYSTNTSLDPAVDRSFSGVTVNVGVNLRVSTANIPLIFKVNGDVTFNGNLSLSGSGGAAGTAGVGANGDGGAGTAGGTVISAFTVPGGNGGAGSSCGASCGEGGAGGTSIISAGSAGLGSGASGVGGITGGAMNPSHLSLLSQFMRGVGCGGGGGGGEGGSSNGALGGKGGGCSEWLIGGNLTLGASSNITCDGTTGANGVANNGGAGGGGAGGSVIFLVAGHIINSGVTISCAGGNGGTGAANGGPGGNGGAGAAGKVLIYSISTGQLITN